MIILGLRDPQPSLRTRYQVQNETQIRKNQKVMENDNDELIVKNYPKNKKQTNQQPKFKPPNCFSCKRNKMLDFDEGYYCRNCEYICEEQKHQVDEKVLRQDHCFSTELTFAKKD